MNLSFLTLFVAGFSRNENQYKKPKNYFLGDQVKHFNNVSQIAVASRKKNGF